MVRGRFAALFLIVCLFGAGARATGDTQNVEKAMSGMLEGILSNIGKGPAATLASSASSVKSALLEQYSMLSKQMGDQLATYEANFCTPGKFTPGTKKPATFVGASMALTFDSGSCYFNDTKWIQDGVKELNCTEPSIVYTHDPANFTSAYHKAATFTSQFCQISKAFGEPMEKVLFVFDGKYTDGEVVDVQSLASKVTDELQSMLSSMTSTVGDMRSTLFDGLQLPLQSVGSKA